MLRDEEYEQLIARCRAREMAERLDVVERCKERVASHNAGPAYWLRTWTATENYHWKEQGRDPVAPFPYMPYPADHWTQERLDALSEYFTHDFTLTDPPDYIDIVLGFLLFHKRLNIPKSREMLTSWTVCGYATWECQFFEKTEWIGQSEKDEKAQGLIRYANILYGNQEPWMREMFPLKRGDAGTVHRIEWANGSRFIAVPEGERQVASYHPSGYFNDESAHQAAYLATLSVVAPVAKQIVCISSAAPGPFAVECES